MGGNAVFAYHQAFDIEGDSGMIARGYGTACKIVRASKSNVIESQRLLTAAIRDAENQRNQHNRKMSSTSADLGVAGPAGLAGGSESLLRRSQSFDSTMSSPRSRGSV